MGGGEGPVQIISLDWSIYIQEVWTNVGVDFLMSFWLTYIAILTFLKQIFLELIFVLDGSEITHVELAGCVLLAENILKSFRCLHPCRWYKKYWQLLSVKPLELLQGDCETH